MVSSRVWQRSSSTVTALNVVSYTVKVIKSRRVDNAYRRAANCLGYTNKKTLLLLLSRASDVAGCTWVSMQSFRTSGARPQYLCFIQVSISHESCESANNVIAPNVRSEWLMAGITLEYRTADARVEGVPTRMSLES